VGSDVACRGSEQPLDVLDWRQKPLAQSSSSLRHQVETHREPRLADEQYRPATAVIACCSEL